MKKKFISNVALESYIQVSLKQWFEQDYQAIRETYDSLPFLQAKIFIGELARELKTFTESIDYSRKELENVIKFKLGIEGDYHVIK